MTTHQITDENINLNNLPQNTTTNVLIAQPMKKPNSNKPRIQIRRAEQDLISDNRKNLGPYSHWAPKSLKNRTILKKRQRKTREANKDEKETIIYGPDTTFRLWNSKFKRSAKRQSAGHIKKPYWFFLQKNAYFIKLIEDDKLSQKKITVKKDPMEIFLDILDFVKEEERKEQWALFYKKLNEQIKRKLVIFQIKSANRFTILEEEEAVSEEIVSLMYLVDAQKEYQKLKDLIAEEQAEEEILQRHEEFLLKLETTKIDFFTELQNKKDQLRKSAGKIYLTQDQLKEVPIKKTNFRNLKDLIAVGEAKRINIKNCKAIIAFGPVELTLEVKKPVEEIIPVVVAKKKKTQRERREFIIIEEEKTVDGIHEILAEKLEPYNVPQNPYLLFGFLLQVLLGFLFMRVNLFVRPATRII
jgi:hypothetical protein